MKIRAESVRVGRNPFGCGVVLTGGGLRLSMGIPDLTASKIHNAQNPGSPDGRMTLEDVMDQHIIQMGITELRIDNISESGVYSATLVVNGAEHRVVPSEGILLCILAGASIYFDSDLEGVKPEQ